MNDQTKATTDAGNPKVSQTTLRILPLVSKASTECGDGSCGCGCGFPIAREWR